MCGQVGAGRAYVCVKLNCVFGSVLLSQATGF